MDKMTDDPFDLVDFEESRKQAQEREAKRNAIREKLRLSIESLNESEKACEINSRSAEYLHDIVSAKLAVYRVLKALEGESNNIHERNLLIKF